MVASPGTAWAAAGWRATMSLASTKPDGDFAPPLLREKTLLECKQDSTH